MATRMVAAQRVDVDVVSGATTTARALQRANEPTEEPVMLRNWLIAHDLDGSADEAIDVVAGLAEAAVGDGGPPPRLVLCTVVPPLPLVISPDVMGLPDVNADLAADVEGARAALDERRVALALKHPRLVVEARLLRGAPGPLLVDASEREHVDAIAVGSRNRRGLSRVLLGSVAGYVSQHARKPVLVVHPAESHGLAVVM